MLLQDLKSCDDTASALTRARPLLHHVWVTNGSSGVCAWLIAVLAWGYAEQTCSGAAEEIKDDESPRLKKQ